MPPCSKSYAQRVLAASLLCPGRSTLHNLEYCDDTRAALRCIAALGARIARPDGTPLGVDADGSDGIMPAGGTLVVTGGLQPKAATLHVGESGLSARLFTPLAALAAAPVVIEGEGSLLRRPMAPILEPLRRLGVRIRDHAGLLPLEVCGPMRGGDIEIDGSVSSQFVTGLLLALPCAEGDSTLRVRDAVSIPYIDMTVETARRFGVEICHNDYREFYIPGGQRYAPVSFEIEGDWSAAAMLLAAGAVAGEVTVRNVSMLSKQADTAICTALVRAGAAIIDEADAVTAIRRPLHAFEFDATQCPDLFPALAVLAAAAEGVSVLRGTSRLGHKECDRAEAIREEYGKLGIEVDISTPDIMRIRGDGIRGGSVRSHGDHRMAMSLAATALRSKAPIEIEGAESVAKSYPEFFRDLERLRAR